jgi:hypothetical protein
MTPGDISEAAQLLPRLYVRPHTGRPHLAEPRQLRRKSHPIQAPVVLEETMRESIFRLGDVEELLSEAVLVRRGAPAEVLVVDQVEHLKRGRPITLEVLDQVLELTAGFEFHLGS